MDNKRQSGLLLHITSLPSKWGSGDFGLQAFNFIDFLSKSSQKIWQVLPLNAVSSEYKFSPYSPTSVFALNDLLISPEKLIESGLINRNQINSGIYAGQKAYFVFSATVKRHFIQSALENELVLKDNNYLHFQEKNREWLFDFALFRALKRHFGHKRSWTSWPLGLVQREKNSIDNWKKKLSREIIFETFSQFLAHTQWQELKNYAHQNGVQIMGDLPFYPAFESSDVWANQKLFRLNDKGEPLYISGAPPDYFSTDGQLWNTPVYFWPAHRENKYTWWMSRIQKNTELYDFLRLDHFRGFCAYWQVPAGEKNAKNGKWIPAPGKSFINKLLKIFKDYIFIAEDLGEITPDVIRIKEHHSLPGMHVLQFAFGPDMSVSPHVPHNHKHKNIVYTGTHDNNTVLGWYMNETGRQVRKRLRDYAAKRITKKDAANHLIRLAMASVADTAIIPVQDILNLDGSGRMNTPAGKKENWVWRLAPDQLQNKHMCYLNEICSLYGRN